MHTTTPTTTTLSQAIRSAYRHYLELRTSGQAHPARLARHRRQLLHLCTIHRQATAARVGVGGAA